jgi:hypothetical protein
MVIRVSPTLRPTLGVIADRLLTETGLDYSHASIVRGLVAVGLVAVEKAPHLAPLFVGVRIARGRKKGPRRRS